MDDQVALAYDDRHRGQDATLSAGKKSYRDDTDRVEVAIATLARSGVTFNADSVHKEVLRVDPTPYNRNLVSARMGKWTQHGWLEEDFSRRPVPSANRSRKGSRNRWWRGVRIQTEEAA